MNIILYGFKGYIGSNINKILMKRYDLINVNADNLRKKKDK